MKTLFIDTSSSNLEVSIIIDGKSFSKRIESINEHSKYAIKTIEDLFKDNNIKPDEIDSIMVINGPGSFTGLRIGVTIAKVYAWSFNLKLIPISTLKAYALSNSNYDYYVSVIDARRDYVYAGVYDKDYNNIINEKYMSIEELTLKLKDYENYLLIGNKDIEEKKAITPNLNVDKIFEYYKDYKGVSPYGLVPYYLKKVEAEEKMEGKA